MKQLLAFIFTFSMLSLSAQSLWTEVKESNIPVRSDQEVTLLPNEYKAYSLDYSTLQSLLSIAPEEDLSINIESQSEITLPLPDGSLEVFKIYNSPVMAPGLAAKYPQIQSYKGVSTTDPYTTVRFDLGENGFHAAIHSMDDVFYIDPYASGDKEHYITYNVKDDPNTLPEGIPSCGVDHTDTAPASTGKKNDSREETVPLRIYRIAIACTGEYGAWKGTVENALSDINTGLNRMNQVFEKEASLRYVLVDRNDELLHFNAISDPYGNTSEGGAMISVNTAVIGSAIGLESFDIGHVYSRSCDVGGVARLGSLCDPSSKGAGATCHYSSDLNFMAVSVTAHEIGHQMSAAHTFNNCNSNSAGNGPAPGSGTTIMSYAGLCGNNNVQPVADDHYHTWNLMQIYNHTRVGIADECAVKEDFNNHPPVITLPEAYRTKMYVPHQTPFFLEGSATDMDDDPMTFAWDGMNLGPVSPFGSPTGEAPHFRVFSPNSNPLRYFPSIDNIYLSSFDPSEVLPTGSKTMKFSFTVRDNNPNGSTATWEEMEFEVIETPTKWQLTGDMSGQSLKFGEEYEVTWDVAETDQAPIDLQFVDILFADKSLTEFDIRNLTVLAERVPNDGSHTVRMPNIPTNLGRIILKAHNGIYFDISNFYMQVKEPEESVLILDGTPTGQFLCLPTTMDIELGTSAYGITEGDVTFTVDGLPDGTVATFANETVALGGGTMLNLDFSNVDVTDYYNPIITATASSGEVTTRDLSLDLVSNDFSDMLGLTPESGTSGLGGSPVFSWSPSENVITYDFELSTSPDFSNLVQSVYGITETEFTDNFILDKNTLYYWRVRGNNLCGPGSYSPVSAFSTAALSCETIEANNLPINITGSGTPIIEAEFNVFTQGTIASVSVPEIKGDHELNKDLVVSLQAPSGTEVKFFDRICLQSNFRCGFSDESNTDVKCPLNSGDIYRPLEPLSGFSGEMTQGVWKLIVNDTKSGNGGQLKEASIELCSNTSVENPTMVNIAPLQAPTNFDTRLGSWNLKATDGDTEDKELKYTLVEAPKIGTLLKINTPLSVGQKFSQNEINSLFIKYRSTDIEGEDSARFTVTDGTGGWVGIFTLDIVVNGSFTTSTTEADVSKSVSLYPNPASDYITLSTLNELTDVRISDTAGKLITTLRTAGNDTQINVSDYRTGVYILEARTTEGNVISKKIVVTR